MLHRIKEYFFYIHCLPVNIIAFVLCKW